MRADRLSEFHASGCSFHEAFLPLMKGLNFGQIVRALWHDQNHTSGYSINVLFAINFTTFGLYAGGMLLKRLFVAGVI